MNTPTVTVVTALYNSAPFIEETIESVRSQSFSDWEMIIVDDRSTDGSAEIAAAFAARDPRIVLITLEKNSGAAVARNRAIDEARGRYIAFLDSDDRWLPRKLERQITFMEEHSYAITHTWFEKCRESGEPLGITVRPPEKMDYRSLLKSNRIGCLTVIYDTAALGKVRMPLIRKRQDYGLWLNILRDGNIIYTLPESLALYRVRAGSISENKLEMVGYNWRLYREVEGFGPLRAAYYLLWNIYRKLRYG